MLNKLFGLFRDKTPAYEVYGALVEAARNPVFYKEFAVEDDVTGRFDMILLHLFMVSERMQAAEENMGHLPRDVVEAMISDMDRSLREMGVGDMSVGKQVKEMGKAWFGREEAYKNAVADKNPLNGMAKALHRNVYRSEPGKNLQLALYVLKSIDLLAASDDESIKHADLRFADPKEFL